MRLNMRAEVWINISNAPEPTEKFWAYIGSFQCRASINPGAFKTGNDLYDRGKVSLFFSTGGSFDNLPTLGTQFQLLVKTIKGSYQTYYIVNTAIVLDSYVQLEGTQYYGERPV